MSPKHQPPSDGAARMKQLRARLGLTEEHLGRLIGVSVETVSRWEAGEETPPTSLWRVLVEAEERGTYERRRPTVELLPVAERSASVSANEAGPVLDLLRGPRGGSPCPLDAPTDRRVRSTVSLPVRDFCLSVKTNRLFPLLEQAFFDATGRTVGPSEHASWLGSLPRLSGAIGLAALPDGTFIELEVQIPYYSERIDAVLYGHDGAGFPFALLVELKQWSEVAMTDDGRLTVAMRTGPVQMVHPSYQVDGYRRHLTNFGSSSKWVVEVRTGEESPEASLHGPWHARRRLGIDRYAFRKQRPCQGRSFGKKTVAARPELDERAEIHGHCRVAPSQTPKKRPVPEPPLPWHPFRRRARISFERSTTSPW